MSQITFKPRQPEPGGELRWPRQALALLVANPWVTLASITTVALLDSALVVVSERATSVAVLSLLLMMLPGLLLLPCIFMRCLDQGFAACRERLGSPDLWIKLMVLATPFGAVVGIATASIPLLQGFVSPSWMAAGRLLELQSQALLILAVTHAMLTLPLLALTPLSIAEAWKVQCRAPEMPVAVVAELAILFFASWLASTAQLSLLASTLMIFGQAMIYVIYRELFERPAHRTKANQAESAVRQGTSVVS